MKDDEKLKNWNEKDNQISLFPVKSSSNKQLNQFYNTMSSLNKSHDSTLDQVINRDESPARFSQGYSQVAKQTLIKEEIKIETNDSQIGESSAAMG